MELHFLGTGSAFPSPKRSASCTVFRHDRGGLWIFDCGEGSQIQFQKSVLKPNQIKKVFITHLHGDHLFGLQGLMCTIGMSLGQADDVKHVDLYGPAGLKAYIRTCLRLSYSNLPYTFSVHEIVLPSNADFYRSLDIPFDESFWTSLTEKESEMPTPPKHPNELEEGGSTIVINENGHFDVCVDDGLTVKAAIIKHTIPCLGYVIQEDDLPGKLDVSILKSKGVPPGPLYGKIKNGETITLENGEVIRPEDCVGPKRRGRKVVILGDTYCSDNILSIGANPDVLVHESTNETADEVKSREHGHSSSRMAGEFGRQLKAKQLVLTHFSQRYRSPKDEEKEGTESVEKLLEEAKVAFKSGNVIVADDLDVVSIPLPR